MAHWSAPRSVRPQISAGSFVCKYIACSSSMPSRPVSLARSRTQYDTKYVALQLSVWAPTCAPESARPMMQHGCVIISRIPTDVIRPPSTTSRTKGIELQLKRPRKQDGTQTVRTYRQGYWRRRVCSRRSQCRTGRSLRGLRESGSDHTGIQSGHGLHALQFLSPYSPAVALPHAYRISFCG